MRAESVQQRLAEVNSSHGKSKHCKRDGLEAAAAPDVDGNAVIMGRYGMGGEKFLVFPDLVFHSPVNPGITLCKNRIIMGLYVIVHKKRSAVPAFRDVLLWR
jgi:hypothetical protein